MGASRVFFARHGERIDHVDKAWASTQKNPYDPYLTETGLAQARHLGKALAGKNIAHVFVSPFYRTVQTASQVALEINATLNLEPGMGEWFNAEWYEHRPVLRSPAELAKEFPQINTAYVPAVVPKFPETREEAIARSAETAKKLTERHEGNILCIGHGMTCEFVARGIVPMDGFPYVAYCALSECVRDGDTYTLSRAPDVSFIPESIRPFVRRSSYQ